MPQPDARSAVIVVDGHSTGQFYAPEVRRRGYSPVHVSSGTEKRSAHYGAMAAMFSERYATDYDLALEGDQDQEELVARLAALNPAAVLAGAEAGVELADRLAERLGLPGNGTALSLARRDKYAMQRVVADAGIRSLASLRTDSLEELLAFAEGLGSWPVVLKPLRSAATEGVRFCRSPEELARAFHDLRGTVTMFGDLNAQVLAQECVQGLEYAVNTVSGDGRHLLSDLWTYHKIPLPGEAPIYDRTRLVLRQDEAAEAVVAYARRVLDALGVRFGPAHVEVMLTDSGPVLIECGLRPMGGSFPQDLLRESLGRTQIEWSLDSCLDPAGFAEGAARPYQPRLAVTMKTLISTRTGELAAAPGVTLLSRLPSARWGNFLLPLASGRVSRTVDLLTCAALVLLCHEDEAVVDEDYALIRELEEEAQDFLFELVRPSRAPTPSAGDWPAPGETRLARGAWTEDEAEAVWRLLGLTAGDAVLACPCGDGQDLAALARRGARATGLDSDPGLVEQAGRRAAQAGLPVDCQVGDGRALSRRESFQAVIHRLPSPGRLDVEADFDVLRRLAEALRPGGRLYLETPRPAAKGDGGDDAPAGPAGARRYSLAQCRLLLRLAGLKLVRVLGEDPSPLNEASPLMGLVAEKPAAPGRP